MSRLEDVFDVCPKTMMLLQTRSYVYIHMHSPKKNSTPQELKKMNPATPVLSNVIVIAPF